VVDPDPSDPNVTDRPDAQQRVRSIVRWATGAGRRNSPITLVVGWIMSCALVTAVTLTAVQRLGHEVSSGPNVTSAHNVQEAVDAAQSSVEASQSAVSPRPAPTAAVAPTTPPPPAPQTNVTTASPRSSSASPSTKHTAAPSTPASPSSPASTTPPSSPSGSPTSSPSGSPTSSPSGSATPSPSATPTPFKFVTPQGEIAMSCVGDQVAYAYAQPQGAGFSVTGPTVNNSAVPPAPQVDVIFTTTDSAQTQTEYQYWCRAGKAVSTPPSRS
jgi:hypothetical protein